MQPLRAKPRNNNKLEITSELAFMKGTHPGAFFYSPIDETNRQFLTIYRKFSIVTHFYELL
jgi:hypothetical protein